jgi:hypothetical protein
MSTHSSTDVHADEYDDTPVPSESPWLMLLATGSAIVLGYFVGRVSYERDLDDAIRRIEESPEPVTVSIRTL